MQRSQAGAQRKNLEVGTGAEGMEELCLLTCSTWLAQSTFFIAVRATNLGAAPPTTHSDLGPPVLITNQEISQDCPKANLVGEFSQLMSPLLKWLQLVLSVDIRLASPGTNRF